VLVYASQWNISRSVTVVADYDVLRSSPVMGVETWSGDLFTAIYVKFFGVGWPTSANLPTRN